jgi:hypothetical protein
VHVVRRNNNSRIDDTSLQVSSRVPWGFMGY